MCRCACQGQARESTIANTLASNGESWAPLTVQILNFALLSCDQQVYCCLEHLVGQWYDCGDAAKESGISGEDGVLKTFIFWCPPPLKLRYNLTSLQELSKQLVTKMAEPKTNSSHLESDVPAQR
jgi:hypothetical protein